MENDIRSGCVGGGKKISRRMGSRAAQGAVRFWNVAEVSGEEGEITLYGDVMSRRPTDWWTGEPEPGLYITPEGFMEDLAMVKDKEKITVKLNSCGGDLYTGIAIHNALKGLAGKVNVIVEGIAASAASVIMCAGDTVTVYPGSMVMIHGVSVMLWDYLNIQDMKQLIKKMDANERAVAEIYSEKTGIAVDTLRGMMTKETWFTGREALEKGFADEIREDGTEPDMSVSLDRKVLYVNGISHNVDGMHNIPGIIPVEKVRSTGTLPQDAGSIPGMTEKGKGGEQRMTLDELKEKEPDLVAQIEADARAGAQANADAVAAERRRIEEIDSIAASVPDPQLVADAKYGENPCTAQELCFRVMQQSAASGRKFLDSYLTDGRNSGTANVGAAPNGGAAATQEEQNAADIQDVVNAYNKSRGGKEK